MLQLLFNVCLEPRSEYVAIQDAARHAAVACAQHTHRKIPVDFMIAREDLQRVAAMVADTKNGERSFSVVIRFAGLRTSAQDSLRARLQIT